MKNKCPIKGRAARPNSYSKSLEDSLEGITTFSDGIQRPRGAAMAEQTGAQSFKCCRYFVDLLKTIIICNIMCPYA